MIYYISASSDNNYRHLVAEFTAIATVSNYNHSINRRANISDPNPPVHQHAATASKLERLKFLRLVDRLKVISSRRAVNRVCLGTGKQGRTILFYIL